MSGDSGFARYRAPLCIGLPASFLRFWHLGRVALIPDESYYWLWSKRLALAYYDNAAGVAWMVRLSSLLGGQSELGIRWLNALLGMGTVYVAYSIGSRLFSQRAGIISAAILALGAPFLIVSRFVYTDALQIALLLFNVFLVLPFVTGEPAEIPPWRFWAVGLSMAALFNTKYNAYLYALAVLGMLAWRRRSLLHDRRTWLAIAIAATGLLPVLLWNASHDWASFRWQYQHFVAGPVFRSTFWHNVMHAVRYLTPPVVLVSVLGAMQIKQLRRQILLVPALVLILPILLGSTDSPRNLLAGIVLLILLAGDAIDRWMGHSNWLAWGTVGGLLVITGLYGLGTVIETERTSALPASSIAQAIRVDSSGWRDAEMLGLHSQATVFALDYSIAPQLRYYAGVPVYTAWGQYQIWGLPPICGADALQGDVQIVALPYLDPAMVSARLHDTFADIQGPIEISLGERSLRIWTVRHCTVDQQTFLDRFDFLGLLQSEDSR